MKTSTQTNGRQTVPVNKLLSILIIAVLFFGASCTQTEIKENEASEPCFTKESLQTVPWIKDQLAWFQVPKEGALRVAVYRYRGQDFLAFENPSLSSPMSYIFNCAGKKIGELDINYNEFYDHVELTAILLEGKY
ncbi:hypothetical protein LZD49_02160 [Dyadobacter sp. CY261]|uniref:hypothetical protein n=1 Tax=Dyadobacter sp. CY261 TaxID=2907203 RepID=UPI001F1A820E|nr:hypothetical protein [Dyadobacter sp. CY261]MCF0069257.1 hypothetical protein [Dyadobacter sp. CY261]